MADLILRRSLLLVLIFGNFAADVSFSQIEDEQQAGILAENHLERATAYYRTGKFKESAAYVAEAQSLLIPLSSSSTKRTRLAAKKLLVKIDKAKKLLKKQGISIPTVKPKSFGNDKKSPNTKPMGTTVESGAPGISFARTIAPVLVEKCIGCHGTERQRAELSFATFEGLNKGGRSGSLRVPGQSPAENVLIKKLRGTGDGEQMPLGGDPLPEKTIKLIEEWLAEGAAFDGNDPQASLADVVALVQSDSLSADELFEQRKRLDLEKWNLAFPNVKPQVYATSNLRFMASSDSRPLQPIADQIASRVRPILAELGLPDDTQIKGGLSFFLLDRRFDYAEFCQMVERRDLPDGFTGHWHDSPIDPYIVVLAPREQSDGSELMVRVNTQLASFFSRQLAGKNGEVPEWFRLGIGRAIAARLARKSESVRKWQEQSKLILRGGMDPEAFFRGNLSSKENALVSYALASRMLLSKKGMRQLAKAMQNGASFQAAFKSVYRVRPLDMLQSLTRGFESK